MATQTTGGGSTTSFGNTPQAQSDTYGWTEEQLQSSGLYNSSTNTITLDVMANDLGGKAKTLWSIEDGGSDVMSELLKSNVTTAWEKTAEGNWIRIYNGKIEYRIDDGSNSPNRALSIDSLTASDHIQDSFYYSIRLANGTLSYAKVTLEIIGQNDAAAIDGKSTGTVTEAGGSNNGDPGLPSASGTVTVYDSDLGEKHFQAPSESALNGSYGSFNFDATTGEWTYALDNARTATQALQAGQVMTETLTVWSADGTASKDIVVTVTGGNDDPTTSAVTLAAIAEDSGGRLITQAELLANASDIDSATLTATGLTIDSGSGTLTDNGDGTWTYTPAANDDSGVSFSYTINDGNGGSVAGTASLDLTAVNDDPTTSAVTLAAIAEDSGGRLITQAELLANASDIDSATLTATGLTIDSGSGTLTDNGDGTWTYTPAANDDSGVSFSYTINDGNGGSVAGTASLDLTAVNDDPTTSAVTLAAIAEDSGGRLITQAELLANASDIDSATLTATGLTIDSGSGTLIDNGDGTWTYTPAANDDSGVSFSYTINDGNGGSVAGTASLDLTAVNDDPTTSAVTLAAIAEDSGGRLITQAELLANASDIDSATLTATGLTIDSGSGTLIDNGDGTWTYTPAANDDSGVSFSYTINDGNGGSVAGTASLDLTAVNDDPTTSAVTLAAIAEDSGGRLITQAELLANASDIDSATLTATGLTIDSGSGTLTDNGDGTWTYTPAANDDSGVSFSYTINDGNGGSVAGTASLDLTAVNDDPTTSAVTLAAIAEDSGARVITQAELLANASDIDSATLTATGLTIDSGSGTLIDNGDGTWTYTPAANDDSGVSFSYTINDGNGGSVAGTASLDLTPVNDDPTTSAVTLAAIAEDSGGRVITQAELLANASDIDSATLTATGLTIDSGSGTLIDNGDGTWTYTPAANDDSGVSFSYTINDGNGGSVAGTASLDLTAVNDDPTTSAVTLAAIAEDSGGRLITQAELLANASDIDSATLTATGLTIDSGSGTLTDNGDGTWTYTPAANDDSGVSFSYTINDGNGGSVAGTASLDLTAVNDDPTTSAVTLAAIAEDSGGRLITQAELLANASDIDSATLTATGLTIDSGSGTLIDNGDGTWTYTPAANDDSGVSFSYTINDGNGGSVAGTASLDLTAVNDDPTTSAVTLAAIAEDSGGRLITQAELLANASDIDSATLTATGLTIDSGSGTLIDNGDGTWTYTPAANDDSGVSFSYTINDGNGGSVAGTASLDLTAVNDDPTTSAVTLAAIAEDSGGRLITQAELLANASDIDSATLTATGLTIDSGSGTLTDNGDGTWTYTPAANDDSGVSFSYTINDGNGGSVAGTASLDLTPVNDDPTTSAVTLAAIAEDSGGRVITQAELLANASDIDSATLTATGLTIDSGSGTLIDNGDGTWTYTPAANDDSGVSFSYTINDGNGGSVAGTASLDLTPVNDAPVNTVPSAQTVNSNTASAIGGVAVADVDSANVTTAVSVSHGKLTVGAGGGVTVSNNGSSTVTISGTLTQVNAALAALSYISDTNYGGADTLTVASSDGLLSDTDTVALTVNPPPNQAPAVPAFTFNAGAVSGDDGNKLLSGTHLGAFAAVDPNGDTVTYGFGGGATAGLSLNPTTGALNLSADLNNVDQTFNVVATDSHGNQSTTTTVRLWVGTSGQNTPTFTNNSETIIAFGLNQSDTITITGGSGHDVLVGGGGADALSGGGGNDWLIGGGGNDWLIGGAGNNILAGGIGDDTFDFGNFGSAVNHVTDFETGTNSTTVDRLRFDVGTGAGAFSVGDNDATVENFKSGNNAALNVAGTELAVKTDASVTNVSVQSTINGYGNITSGAFFVFHNSDMGHAAVYYDPNPSATGGAILVTELDNVTLLGNLGNLNAGDFQFS